MDECDLRSLVAVDVRSRAFRIRPVDGYTAVDVLVAVLTANPADLTPNERAVQASCRRFDLWLRAMQWHGDALLRWRQGAAESSGQGDNLELTHDDDVADLGAYGEHPDTRSPPPPITVVLADTLARHAPPVRFLTPSTREERAA
jgi:hypothetical protein